MMDYYSGFVNFCPIKTKKPGELFSKNKEEWCLRYGFRTRIHSDNEPSLMGSTFRDYLTEWSIEYWTAATYDHLSNSKVERVQRFLKDYLKILHLINPMENKRWVKYLAEIAHRYSTNVVAGLNVIPHESMFGKTAKLLDDPIGSRELTEEETKNIENRIVQVRLEGRQRDIKTAVGRSPQAEVEARDTVRWLPNRGDRKLDSVAKNGPYLVVDKEGETMLTLQEIGTKREVKASMRQVPLVV